MREPPSSHAAASIFKVCARKRSLLTLHITCLDRSRWRYRGKVVGEYAQGAETSYKKNSILQQNSTNPALLKAIQGIKHIVPDQTLNKQLDDIYTESRQAITNTDALHNKIDSNIARKKQQQLINKASKKAHEEIILKDKYAPPRASLQAVKDPETGKIETEPTKQAQFLEKYFKDSGKLFTLNTAPTYLKKHLTTHGNTQRTSQEVYPFKLQTKITQDESDGTEDRKWLHSSILDKSAFSECIKTLSNNKSPGPDGIVNELLRMLLTEIQETIHMLFTIMWATGFTPKA